MKDSNYFTICGWMVNNLHLKGNELMVYAIIHGFTQDGNNYFDGSISYLQGFIKSSKNTVMSCLGSLCEKGLISKEEFLKNNIKFCRYKAVEKYLDGGAKIEPPVQKEKSTGAKIEPGISKIAPGGGAKIAPNIKFSILNDIDKGILKDGAAAPGFGNGNLFGEMEIFSPKKEKKKKPERPARDFWPAFISCFSDFYLKNYNRKFSFDDKRIFKYFESIYDILKREIEASQLFFNAENLTASFTHVMTLSVNKSPWYKSNFSPKLILEKYNEITNGATEKKQQPATGANVNITDAFAEINRRHGNR